MLILECDMTIGRFFKNMLFATDGFSGFPDGSSAHGESGHTPVALEFVPSVFFTVLRVVGVYFRRESGHTPLSVEGARRRLFE